MPREEHTIKKVYKKTLKQKIYNLINIIKMSQKIKRKII